MFISPAFVPRTSELAMITVTVGPGTIARREQAAMQAKERRRAEHGSSVRRE
jgi:hypothetical protein